MLEDKNLNNILFLDIETVPGESSFDLLNEDMQMLWDKKSKSFREETQSAKDAYQRAGIYAEFGKIVCISVGYITQNSNGENTIRTKSFAGDNERQLLNDFSSLLNKSYSSFDSTLCGHNIKEFDIPYIARRMLINALPLPKALDIAGKKPWDIKHLDTMELWKFGDYKAYTSLNLLTHIFDIPTPKDDIDGSQVANVYYEDHDIKRIAIYCEKDVVATAQLFLRFQLKPLIRQENIFHIE
jgi:DNA polymerase elongation subunit (family B)